MISAGKMMDKIPNKRALTMADTLLFAVYKWKPDKIRRMKLESVEKWCELAKKRMTFGNAYLLNKILEPQVKKKWWQKIFSK